MWPYVILKTGSTIPVSWEVPFLITYYIHVHTQNHQSDIKIELYSKYYNTLF